MSHVLDEAQCRARGGKGRITQYRTGHSNDRDWNKAGDWTQHTTPWKINMDHNYGGLEDHFPFEMGDL